MTFSDSLLEKGYTYDSEQEAYTIKEASGILHLYRQNESKWTYERYDADDQLVMLKHFTT